MGFIDVSLKQDASTLATYILNFFDINGVSSPIVAQAYDGASVMSGRFNGVQQKIKDKHPHAIYTHCMAHRVNLLVLDICSIVKVYYSLNLLNLCLKDDKVILTCLGYQSCLQLSSVVIYLLFSPYQQCKILCNAKKSGN